MNSAISHWQGKAEEHFSCHQLLWAEAGLADERASLVFLLLLLSSPFFLSFFFFFIFMSAQMLTHLYYKQDEGSNPT